MIILFPVFAVMRSDPACGFTTYTADGPLVHTLHTQIPCAQGIKEFNFDQFLSFLNGMCTHILYC